MPITVRHTPVGAIGRAAVAAGRARGSQLQAERDIQLTSIALAVQSQRWAIESREREGAADRAFAMQQAAAAQMARRRPVTGDALAGRQQLRRTVTEAKATGIYSPVQIKQMELFSSLGDVSGMRSILGRVEKPLVLRETARRRELTAQTTAIEEKKQALLEPQYRELADIEAELSKRYPRRESWKTLAENPSLIPEHLREKFTAMLKRRPELTKNILDIEKGALPVLRGLREGKTVAQQQALRLKAAEAAIKNELVTVRRDQNRIDARLTQISREIKRDIYAEPAKENARIGKLEKERKDLLEKRSVLDTRQNQLLGVSSGRRLISGDEEDARYDNLIATTGGNAAGVRQQYEQRYGEPEVRSISPMRRLDLRLDGTVKGPGFLGTLQRPDGNISTEISIGVEFDGVETQIPTLVPTLTQSETNHLLAGKKPTPAIIKKAIAHAKKRMRAGKSPFARKGE